MIFSRPTIMATQPASTAAALGSSGSSPSSSPPSFINSLIDSLFQPGLNSPARVVMHRAFAALILVLLSLLIVTQNGHVLALLAIALGLWGSVAW